MEDTQKGFIKIVLIVLVILIVGVVGYFVSTRQITPSDPISTTTPSHTPTPMPPPTSYRKQSFETISKDLYSGHNDRKDYVIKEISEWRSLWDIVNALITPKPILPSIDFDDEMIIAVFQGPQSSGGYSIEIVEIIEKANSLEVIVKEISPPLGSVVTTVLTRPFHIVKTKRIDKEIVFVYKKRLLTPLLNTFVCKKWNFGLICEYGYFNYTKEFG